MKIKFQIMAFAFSILITLIFCIYQLTQGITQSLYLHHQKARQQILLDEKTYLTKINNAEDLEFHQLQLQGFFDNRHRIFLASSQHQIMGFEVFSPFYDTQLKTTFLLDLGWIKITNHEPLPALNQIIGVLKLEGLLIKPKPPIPENLNHENTLTEWPLQIQSLDINQLSHLLHTPLSPYLVKLKPNDPLGYDIIWQFDNILPKKHYIQALQWFAFMITLVVSFLFFVKKR